MDINTNYSYVGASNGTYGLNQGILWTLWQYNETCMESNVVFGTGCYSAAYCNPGIVTSSTGLTPYDPTRQIWSHQFELPAGTYLVELMGFGINHTQSSTGSGWINVCGAYPLASPPVLTLDGLTLRWDGQATVYRAENDWVEIGQADSEFKVDKGGIYCVGNEFGLSNYVRANLLVEAQKGMIYNVIGQENAKFGIQTK
jgi:hypothetical protein